MFINLLCDVLLLLFSVVADRVSIETLKERVGHLVLLCLPHEVRQIEEAALEEKKGRD